MTRLITALTCALLIGAATDAQAQGWKGFYLGGHLGTAMQPDDADETVTFDTNLDGTFTDTIRTGAGANAFSPGFCGGLAAGATPALGCGNDEEGIDFGGRAGYDCRRDPWSLVRSPNCRALTSSTASRRTASRPPSTRSRASSASWRAFGPASAPVATAC